MTATELHPMSLEDALRQAVAHHKAKRLREAEQLYRAILQAHPGQPVANHNLGVLAGQAGRNEAGLTHFKAALEANPSKEKYWLSYTTAQLASGQAKEALDTLHAALQRGLDTPAVQSLRQRAEAAIQNTARNGKEPSATECSRLSALFGAGHYAELENGARMLAEHYPDSGFVWKALGLSLQMQGKDALPVLRKATEILPDDAEAHCNLGNALREYNQLDDALASCRRAIEIKPDFALAHNNLGNALQELNRLEEAGASYRRALEIKPDYAEAHSNLGKVLQYLWQPDGAIACFQKAYELGLHGAKVQAALLLPPIMSTRQEMLKSREVLKQNVNKLIETPVQIDDPFISVGSANFFLAYHGLNDRNLQIKIAKLYELSNPSLLYAAPHCAISRPASKEKIRVGFFSKYIYTHSVSRCFSRIVEELAQQKMFEVTLISNHNFKAPDVSNIYSSFEGAHVQLPNHLAQARERVAALKLDILVYLDIGMEPLSYFMAFSRLAHVQCVLGGHPVTTGIGNIDYFLSSDQIEPAGADEHYSEKLVRLPTGAFYFERPALPAIFKTRGELGLPEGKHIYMCPMSLQKIHPDFDEAINRILQIDSNGVVVLFESPSYPFWKTMLAKRFEKTIPEDVRGRILFLPWLVYSDFISANAAADVVLDPFHFGIGSTIIATFAVGTPIVTKPGEFMRGRVGMMICKMMDLMECSVADTEEYARLAVAIATDRSLREEIKAKILANNHVLYENHRPIEELASFFRDIMHG